MDLAGDQATRQSMQKHMESLHESAISLWLDSRKKNPNLDFKTLAAAVHFSITNADWPSNIPRVENAVELCDVINATKGYPPLTMEEKKALEDRAMLLFMQFESGRSPLQTGRYMIWANRVGYGVGVYALFIHGPSWWVIGFIVAVFWSFGAARMAGDAATNADDVTVRERATRNMPFMAFVYFTALSGLYVISIYHIIK